LIFSHRSKVKWAKEEALPQIEQFRNDANFAAAFNLVQRAEKYISKDTKFKELKSWITTKETILTDPLGADVYFREYSDTAGIWKMLGRTPIDSIRLPSHTYYLMKIEKAGYDDILAVLHTPIDTLTRKLFKTGTTPQGMVYVEGLWIEGEGFLKDNCGFFIDRYEVTNKQFKEFVDKGGYRNPQYWKNEFINNGKNITLEKVLSEFTDKTGRQGPATWEAGDYPDGQDNYPVTGVSWYEAAAYAEYAGKSLPTTDHWSGAAEFYTYWFGNFNAKICPLSNFNGKGADPVGRNKGINCYGAFDMAGNVREWCWNESESGRVIRGGGWDDPVYMYTAESQIPSFDRSPKNGFRCVKYIDKEKIPINAFRRTEFFEARDFSKEKPVSENIFSFYKNQFLYDKTPLNAIIEKKYESHTDWNIEKISFRAAYGNERMIAYLYLPKNASPPFQTIVYFPGSDALDNTIDLINYRYVTWNTAYLLKSGRAVMYPVYKGTFERNDGTFAEIDTEQSHQYTEWLIKWVKDLSRSIDYLETRPDIDCTKLGYYGISWGGSLGGIIPAVEKRLVVSTIVTGGIANSPFPEADAINYLPRIKIPVLMLSGKYDAIFPPETTVKPFFNLLGTPAQDKRLIFYETDHFMPPGEIIKETLNWLDHYLGPVKYK
jgi:cephalosporin-C deacetylase-like acetyl esterase